MSFYNLFFEKYGLGFIMSFWNLYLYLFIYYIFCYLKKKMKF
jgi:hypothetical protein